MSLLDVIRKEFPTFPAKEKGWSSAEILTELQNRGYGFPLVSVIDVADAMRSFYGPGGT